MGSTSGRRESAGLRARASEMMVDLEVVTSWKDMVANVVLRPRMISKALERCAL